MRKKYLKTQMDEISFLKVCSLIKKLSKDLPKKKRKAFKRKAYGMYSDILVDMTVVTKKFALYNDSKKKQTHKLSDIIEYDKVVSLTVSLTPKGQGYDEFVVEKEDKPITVKSGDFEEKVFVSNVFTLRKIEKDTAIIVPKQHGVNVSIDYLPKKTKCPDLAHLTKDVGMGESKKISFILDATSSKGNSSMKANLSKALGSDIFITSLVVKVLPKGEMLDGGGFVERDNKTVKIKSKGFDSVFCDSDTPTNPNNRIYEKVKMKVPKGMVIGVDAVIRKFFTTDFESTGYTFELANDTEKEITYSRSDLLKKAIDKEVKVKGKLVSSMLLVSVNLKSIGCTSTKSDNSIFTALKSNAFILEDGIKENLDIFITTTSELMPTRANKGVSVENYSLTIGAMSIVRVHMVLA